MPTLRTRSAKTSALTQSELDANFKRTVTQKTTTYQVLISDNRSVIEGNHATTAFTITLPPVATADDAETGDFEVTITNINAAIVTVDGSGAETIDGAADLDLNQWDSATFQLDSAQTGWKISSTSTLAPVIGHTATNAVMELVWPVGSIYSNVSDSTNPATLFGVGTWTAIEDAFLIGESATYGIGTTGGSADAIVVSHTHTGPSHTHTGTTASDGAHTHTVNYSDNDGAGPARGEAGNTLDGVSSTWVNSGGAHTHTFTTAASGTGATGSTGSSGTNANLPPYVSVYMWKRTA